MNAKQWYQRRVAITAGGPAIGTARARLVWHRVDVYLQNTFRIMKFPKYVIVLSAVGTAAGAFVLFKDSFSGSKFTSDEKITGRTVIITGASSGIGKETAKELAKRGGRIVLACRNLAKCEKVRAEIVENSYNRNVECRHLDLASLKSIREFAKVTNETEKRIDILINNAGVMLNKREVTEDGFEKHLGINYLGHFLLTNLLLDKLIASAPSRIINLSSVGYNNTKIRFTDFNHADFFSYKDSYKQSKLALTMFTTDLAKRLQKTGVTVNAVSPGLVDTDLRRTFPSHSNVISSALLKPIWLVLFKTPVQGAKTTLYCALEPSIADHTGKIFSDCKEGDVSEIATNEDTCKRLWAVSERWTRLKE